MCGRGRRWLSQSPEALITQDLWCRWRTPSVLQAPREQQPWSKENPLYQRLQKTGPGTVSKQLICVPGSSFKNVLCNLHPLLAWR